MSHLTSPVAKSSGGPLGPPYRLGMIQWHITTQLRPLGARSHGRTRRSSVDRARLCPLPINRTRLGWGRFFIFIFRAEPCEGSAQEAREARTDLFYQRVATLSNLTHSCPLGGRPPSGPGVGDPMPWSGFWHDHFQSWMDWGPCSRRCGAGGPAAVDGAFARSASLPTGRCWCGEPRRRRAISYFSSYSWECAVAMDGAAADCGVWTACSSGKPVMRGAWAAAR